MLSASCGLGSITSLTTEIGTFARINVLTERYAYDSFGNLTITNAGPDGVMDNSDDVELAESALGNPYFFTGREFDAESGLYYYRARYYDSSTGTFLQEDPLGFVDSLNLHTYVFNNPLNWVDPFGEQIIIPGISGPGLPPGPPSLPPGVCPVSFSKGGSQNIGETEFIGIPIEALRERLRNRSLSDKERKKLKKRIDKEEKNRGERNKKKRKNKKKK